MALAVFLFVTMTQLDAFWMGRMQAAVIYALIFLSITVVTGLGGQVSLCQATFAATGGFATGQLVDRLGVDVLTAALIGAVVAAAVGALVAVPALRVRSIYLALVTLAFAIMFENIVVPQEWVSGGTRSIRVPRPTVGPFDFADERSFLVLLLLCLAVVSFLVILVRRGTTGRFLDVLPWQRGRRAVHRHQPRALDLHRLRPLRGHRRVRWRSPRDAAAARQLPGQLQLLLRPRLGRPRRHDGCPVGPGCHHGRVRVHPRPRDLRHAGHRARLGDGPVRPGRPDLRTTPRRHHRGQHPTRERLDRPDTRPRGSRPGGGR
ncbi:MAG: hypothetical protein U5R31_09705 [Acidimicrobiia bacterium]|nr:hypothetical protein [Acidimicrobiia bacterium]